MVELRGLHRVKSKGRTYYYAWRGGPRINAAYGTPDFFTELAEARNPAHGMDQRKLTAWVAKYRASPEFTELAGSTQKQWLPWLDRIREHFGSWSVRLFDKPEVRADIRRWRDKWKATPRTADYGLQVLSRLLSYLVAEGMLAKNICEGVPRIYRANRADIIWLQADIDHFLKTASKEVGWAVRLAGLTGFRQGDILRLTWGHVGAYAIELRTGKSRGRRTASAPLTGEIKALLDEIRAARPGKDAMTILTTSAGHPWRGFNSSFTTAKAKAWPEDRDLNFHDLRGTAATSYYRAGFKVREIAEIMGWSEDRVERLIDRYVKRDEILADRVRRLERARDGL